MNETRVFMWLCQIRCYSKGGEWIKREGHFTLVCYLMCSYLIQCAYLYWHDLVCSIFLLVIINSVGRYFVLIFWILFIELGLLLASNGFKLGVSSCMDSA